MKQIFYYLLTISILNIFNPLVFSQDNSQSEPTLTVESIKISGNTKTREYVIKSFMGFSEGGEINKTRLQRSIVYLEESDFFKDVEVYTQPGSDRGKVMVYVDVKERRWPFFQFKGGYSELDGWYISPLGLRFDNFFGRGNLFGAEFFLGDRVFGLDIDYERPRIFGSEINFGALLYSRTRQYVHYWESDKYIQEVINGGLSLRLNGNRGLFKYLWFELRTVNFEADSVMVKGKEKEKFPLPEQLVPFTGKNNANRIVLSLNVDTRDQPFYPTSGWWGCLSLDQVSKQLGAFMDYQKVILDIRRYQGLMNNWVVALRAKGAQIDDKAPFYDKFYLGGPNSLRGYDDRSLNPLGYASYLVQGSAELRFPITPKKFPNHFLTGVIFYDVGQAWNKPDKFETKELNSSFGYGFRFNLPFIGLVRLDFAYPIPDYDFRVHLSLGHTF
jgi:outer membrane protein insertion porin family